jgi:hypothetical protein
MWIIQHGTNGEHILTFLPVSKLKVIAIAIDLIDSVRNAK